jgi:hypothetical protein
VTHTLAAQATLARARLQALKNAFHVVDFPPLRLNDFAAEPESS